MLDASAGVSALLNGGQARGLVAAESVHVPHLIDVEVASALRRQHVAGLISDAAGRQALKVWTQIGMIRYAATPLLGRVWELRSSITAYDAMYVALAEQLGCTLVTADAKLAGANGMHCAITVVPN